MQMARGGHQQQVPLVYKVFVEAAREYRGNSPEGSEWPGMTLDRLHLEGPVPSPTLERHHNAAVSDISL